MTVPLAERSGSLAAGDARRVAGRPAARRRGPSGRLLFALPAFAFLIVFFVYPLGLLFDTSVREVSLGSAATPGNPLVGAENYRTVLAETAFREAVPRTLIFLIGSVALQLVLGLCVALVLNERFRGVAIPRFLIYFVWLLPPVVSGAVWKYALDGTEQGAVNDALLALGVVDSPVLFLTRPAVALAAITLVTAWAGVPFVAIVLTAALKDVPGELYEAARVDGCGSWHRFRWVTLPSVTPTLSILGTLLLIYSFKAFDYIFVLTQGGPGTSTSTVPYLAYLYSFAQFDFGLGSAIGVVSVVTALVFAVPYLLQVRKEEQS
ncbi:sugar ABC transporter permease [Micromonospora sp. NPDC050980]|uniref:carbohydrate ABC transporter permease n=1 Tax=Micromonospora sp. NPDC050980 TaxID=3155161 RepID=UPI0033DEE551